MLPPVLLGVAWDPVRGLSPPGVGFMFRLVPAAVVGIVGCLTVVLQVPFYGFRPYGGAVVGIVNRVHLTMTVTEPTDDWC